MYTVNEFAIAQIPGNNNNFRIGKAHKVYMYAPTHTHTHTHTHTLTHTHTHTLCHRYSFFSFFSFFIDIIFISMNDEVLNKKDSTKKGYKMKMGY